MSDAHQHVRMAPRRPVKRGSRSTTRRMMLQALIQNAPDLITLFDRDRIARYVSPSAERITGYASEDLLGRPFSDFVHPDDCEPAYRAFAGMVATHKVRTVETRFRRKGGSWVALESLGIGVPDLRGVLVSSRDITQHVEVEATLRQSAQESTQFFEEAPCGYHAVDGKDLFRMVNNTELGWLQRTREELVGRMTFAKLVSPATRPAYWRCFGDLKTKGVVRDTELELVRKDGTVFPVLMQSIAVRDGKGGLIESRTTLFDISERRRAEAALRKINRALEVLSEVREQIIRARTESGLLDRICRIVVERGGYRLAAVHFAEAGMKPRLMASAATGDGRWDWAGAASGDKELGPIGATLRTGAPSVHQNVTTDPRLAPWRELAVRAGIGSLASLPLKDQTGVLGTLSVFAADTDAFRSDELRIWEEMAQDVSFAVGSLSAEKAAGGRAAAAAVSKLQKDVPPALSPREQEILKLVAEERSTREIAAALGIAPASVTTYRGRLMVKLGVRNAAGLVRIAVRRGLITA